MINSDGRATISNHEGEAGLQGAIGKPKLVEDVIARDSAPAVDQAMAHGAARAFATIRESITDGTCKTLNDVLALSAALQLTYESLIRA